MIRVARPVDKKEKKTMITCQMPSVFRRRMGLSGMRTDARAHRCMTIYVGINIETETNKRESIFKV